MPVSFVYKTAANKQTTVLKGRKNFFISTASQDYYKTSFAIPDK